MVDPKKIAIGFITYSAAASGYLPYFLESLEKQTIQGFKVFALDNNEDLENESKNIIIKHPEINFTQSGNNLGFAKGFNLLIKRALSEGCEYFLALNVDMILESDVVERLVAILKDNSHLGSVAPKILKWDFKNKSKTEIIDTLGIKQLPGLRFVDLNQGKIDRCQSEEADILGPSGAAAMYRISSLEYVKVNKQYFDELMFMYKEDCDLAYRLNLAGYKSECVREAVVYHDRTASSTGENDLAVVSNRKNKNKRVKSWSFLNQQIIFLKFWGIQDFKNKMAVIRFGLKMIIYSLFFEQYLLLNFVRLFKIRNKIIRYR